jgi:asparagine synthase (glutamine-hydrolysing)
MSGIAAIINFDGRPVSSREIELITGAMAYRGPDGIKHWRSDFVALGQCMLRTTPESLDEVQPLTNEDESLVLVMDGRVDNREDLKRRLLGKGAVLRDASDAEMVLRAYEVWGEECPHYVIGECVFLVWDARARKLFAVRDAAGARHFYYHYKQGLLVVATEAEGILALPSVERRLNEEKLLDYWVAEFDRGDQSSSFYEGIFRLPAGHAMRVTAKGQNIWRYWNPAELTERKFASMSECAEAFLGQLREVVECRLRSIKPVGALLSGGLDSSTLVGLISKEFRGRLQEPLRTFSLADTDAENCLDWQCVQSIVRADSWLKPTTITPDMMEHGWRFFVDDIAKADNPFIAAYSWQYDLMVRSAQQAGCGVLFEGMAGDIMFYSGEASLGGLLQSRQYKYLPSLLRGVKQQGRSVQKFLKMVAIAHLSQKLPRGVRSKLRTYKDMQSLSAGDLGYLHEHVAQKLVNERRGVVRSKMESLEGASHIQQHAARYTSGLISFAHENGSIARFGMEHRSPYSDRRMIEFAISMPLEAKIACPWYKQLLRQVAKDYLPQDVVWRKRVGYHPGWSFYKRLATQVVEHVPECGDEAYSANALAKWVRPDRLARAWGNYKTNSDEDSIRPMLTAYVGGAWLEAKGLGMPERSA